MKSEPLSPAQIQNVLIENISKKNVCFVFNTNIASSSWAEWLITHSDLSGVKAVPLERFKAWDEFKELHLCVSSSTLKAKKQTDSGFVDEKPSVVPSLLRKLFVRSLIAENAEKAAAGDCPIFKSLINPNPVFAEEAFSFTEWISRILPSLKSWYLKYLSWNGRDDDEDIENADYLMLYNRYSSYLQENNLFEPAWIEPDFSDGERDWIIFYPELLEDYSDYEKMLQKEERIKLYSLPEEDSLDNSNSCAQVLFYSNARTELRRTALEIRRLVAEKKANWTEIAVNVPDLNNSRPYIEREFNLYCIPFVMRAAESLTESNAGRIFREINDCYTNNFSFDTVRTLVLDKYVPWKDEKLPEELVRQGSVHKCVCGYTDFSGKKVDVWEETLKIMPKESSGYISYLFYVGLKKTINALCTAATFTALRTQWFTFKSRFLAEQFSTEADAILGRCISKLNELIDIENKYIIPAGKKVSNPYDFFISSLDSELYQKQQKKAGVSVFPYRLAAEASFKYQFVLDSSQKSLAVPYKVLSFLNQTKRRQLDCSDVDNVSSGFIRLYAEKGCGVFSGSRQSFNGFSILHSSLIEIERRQLSVFKNEFENSFPDKKLNGDLREVFLKQDLTRLSPFDFISTENEFCLSLGEKKYTVPNTIGADNTDLKSVVLEKQWQDGCFSNAQKNGFFAWFKCISINDEDKTNDLNGLRKRNEIAKKRLSCTLKDGFDDGLKITQTDMNLFFPCPRKWIFSKALNLEEDTLDTELMGRYDAGNIYHESLERFMMNHKKEFLPALDSDGDFVNAEQINSELTSFVEMSFAEYKNGLNKNSSPLEFYVLKSQTAAFASVVLDALRGLCSVFQGWKIFDAEMKIETDALGVDGEKLGWKYSGRIDCILVNDEGDAAIVDYKTSKTPAISDCIISQKIDNDGILANFQMPMYVTLLNSYFKTDCVTEAAFFSIQNKKAVPIITANPSSKQNAVVYENFEPTMVEFRRQASLMAEQVELGDYNVTKERVESYKDCTGCKFKTICRTSYTASGWKIN